MNWLLYGFAAAGAWMLIQGLVFCYFHHTKWSYQLAIPYLIPGGLVLILDALLWLCHFILK